MQSAVDGFGLLFGIRSGQMYGSGAGGKYAANRVAGLYGSDSFVRISVTRWTDVTDAGVLRTETTGGGLPTGTGTFTFFVPIVVTHDDAYSTKLVTLTVAVLQFHVVVRTDSGIAPGCVLSSFET